MNSAREWNSARRSSEKSKQLKNNIDLPLQMDSNQQQAPASSARNTKSTKIEVINLDESQKSSGRVNRSHEEALLHLDVALGKNQSTRIVIYPGEDYNQVIDEFSAEHQLSSKKVKKLRDVIKTQMDQMLPPINEESYTTPQSEQARVEAQERA